MFQKLKNIKVSFLKFKIVKWVLDRATLGLKGKNLDSLRRFPSLKKIKKVMKMKEEQKGELKL